jgi:hypothetical protein
MKHIIPLFGLCLLAPALAWAEVPIRPWLGDRSYAEGIGIRLGELELHPGVAAEVGYDSNYFQRSGDEGAPNEHPIYSAYRLRLTPALMVSTLGPRRRAGDGNHAAHPKLWFRSGLFASYNELIGGDEELELSEYRSLELGAEAKLALFPAERVGGDLRAAYARTVQPSNDPGTLNDFDRDTVRGGGGVTYRPGGGLFEWRLGYDARFTYFETDAARHLTNSEHALGTEGRWRFLPKTALLCDTETRLLHYTFHNAVRNDGQTIRSRLGLHGLVSNRFAILVLGGWASSYFIATASPVRANYDDFVAHTELKWFLSPRPAEAPPAAAPVDVGLSHLAVGYLRDFSQSYIADYYRRDRVYGNAAFFIDGRTLLEARAGYSYVTHPSFDRAGVSYGGLTEDRVDVELFGEYRFADGMALNATARYDASLWDSIISGPDASPGEGYWDNLEYARFTLFLGARYFR